MIIVAFDASINNTGWAVLQYGEDLVAGPPFDHRLMLVDHGVIRSRFKDPYDRLLGLCNDATYLRKKYGATDVVIETTSGMLAARLKGTNANMLLYGVAVGGLVMTFELIKMVAADSRFDKKYELHLVRENLWTGGVPKAKRHALTLAEFNLPPKTSHHETDAVALGAWFDAHRRELAAQPEEKSCPKQKKPRVKRTATKKPRKS